MPDREWWRVETLSGTRHPSTVGDLPNREAAVSLARTLAEDSSAALIVVKYTRREVKRFQRVISVAEEDVPSSPPAPPVA